MRIDVIGVYPVAAPEPCHLIEVLIAEGNPGDAVESITQEIPGQPRDNWQVPYDEHFLTADPTNPEPPASETETRIAFFFHYLDLRRPLLTAAGPVQLPAPAPRPARLDFMHYEPPC
jgi:hypothetical protein